MIAWAISHKMKFLGHKVLPCVNLYVSIMSYVVIYMCLCCYIYLEATLAWICRHICHTCHLLHQSGFCAVNLSCRTQPLVRPFILLSQYSTHNVCFLLVSPGSLYQGSEGIQWRKLEDFHHRYGAGTSRVLQSLRRLLSCL